MVCSGQCKNTGREHSKGVPADGVAISPAHPAAEDDVWGDDEVSSYADRKRAHVNQGYLDGITQAQESGLQRGFDDGYPKGAELGMQVGEILANFNGNSLMGQAKTDLNITKVLDKQYFSDDLDVQSHPLIEKWKHSSVEELEAESKNSEES